MLISLVVRNHVPINLYALNDRQLLAQPTCIFIHVHVHAHVYVFKIEAQGSINSMNEELECSRTKDGRVVS